MTPRVQRVASPRTQIANFYRTEILEGRLADGDRLPTVREMTEEWGVSSATCVKAVAVLQAEGLVRTSPHGTYVSAGDEVTYSPRDRAYAAMRTSAIYPPAEGS